MSEKTPPDQKNRKEGEKRFPKRNKNDDKFEWKKARGTLMVWILIVIVAWILFRQLNLTEQPEIQKSYTQYVKILEGGQIASAEIIDREFHGRLSDGSTIQTTLPFIDQRMLAEWDSLKIDYQFKEKTTSWVGYLITSILPWIIIIGIWLYIMRRMQGGGQRGLFSFGKSRAKLMVENKSKITFKDVAGCDEAKEELREVIDFLREPKKFSRLGGRIPKGALLLGPPGTGKTLLARAIAGEAEVPFFSMSGADFVEMFVGVGASRVRDLFEQGKKSAPCIIFIDEIDAVGRHRGAGLGGGHDEREQTLNQLLVEMDGFESNEGVILIAATNRPDVLDPALTRPGRFDRQIVVDRPDVRGREGILKVHARNVPLAPDVRLDVLAKGTPGLSGADLANLVNEAALIAARRGVDKVTMMDFENAKDKVMMGTERKSMLISDDEKRQTAYHEAGHVLVSKLTPGSDPVHKVTIIPRGRALGTTHYLPIDEKHNYSRSYLLQNLVHLLGGRAAEKIIFHEFSTGAGNDIERATQIARKMVCEWGMSDKLGPVSLGNKNEEVFLGRDFHQQRNYSEQTAQEIDSEIHRIITSAEQKATKLLRDNLRKLHALSAALLEKEILDGKEIDIVLKGGRLPVTRPEPLKKEPPPPNRNQNPRAPGRTAAPPPRNQSQGSPKPAAEVSARNQSQGSPKPDAEASASSASRTPKPRPPAAPRSSGPGRRTTRRSGGVASSRDPENQRPSPREIAQMTSPLDDSTARRPAKPRPRRAPQRKPAVVEEKVETSAVKTDEAVAPNPRRRPRPRRSRTVRLAPPANGNAVNSGANPEHKASGDSTKENSNQDHGNRSGQDT